MKYDFKYCIKDLEGNDMDKGTIQEISINALLAGFPDEQNLPGDEKFCRYKLAMRIDDAKLGPVDMTAEEVSELKKLISKGFLPLIVGRCYDFFENPIVT